MTRHYYLKPAPEDFQVTWNGGPEFPGDNNFGTETEPVYLSAGAINEWVYDPLAADPADVDTYQHFFHLMPGEYCVGPAANRDGRYLQGADCIFLQNNLGRPNRKVEVMFSPFYDGDRPLLRSYGRQYTREETDLWPGMKEERLFYTPESSGYLNNVVLLNLDLDQNWDNQGYAAYGITKGFKTNSIQIRANNYLIKGCRVINNGANSDMVGGSLLTSEAFPINMYSLEALPGSGIVEDCEVAKFHSVNGGYATMIAVCPFTAIPEPRPVIFWTKDSVPGAPAAIVRNCLVRGVRVVNGCGASGSGVLAARGALFENNVFEGCSIGANFDTGGMWNVQLNGNTFIDCNEAVQMGTPTGNALANRAPDPMVPPFMYNFLLWNNQIRIKRNDVQLNKDCPDRVKACLLHIRNNSAGMVAHNNRVFTVDHGNFATWIGATEVERYWRFINLSGMDPYTVPGYYGSFGPANTVIDDPLDGRFEGNTVAGVALVAQTAPALYGKNFVTEMGQAVQSFR